MQSYWIQHPIKAAVSIAAVMLYITVLVIIFCLIGFSEWKKRQFKKTSLPA
jgi:hypothetical protein